MFGRHWEVPLADGVPPHGQEREGSQRHHHGGPVKAYSSNEFKQLDWLNSADVQGSCSGGGKAAPSNLAETPRPHGPLPR
eukprot:scaffold53384_cov34-Tisochrysis_lutea.AAC.1